MSDRTVGNDLCTGWYHTGPLVTPPPARAANADPHDDPIPLPPHENGPRLPECPVIAVAQQAIDSAQALARTLRKLRACMADCHACHIRRCPLLADFNDQLTIALQEIADEWSLN